MTSVDKHIIIANGRTGSNHLVSSLNSHPAILNYGEVCATWSLSFRYFGFFLEPAIGTRAYLRLFYEFRFIWCLANVYRNVKHRSIFTLTNKSPTFKKKRCREIKSVGMKELWQTVQLKNLSDLLSRDTKMKFVILFRSNDLHRYISTMRLDKSGVSFVHACEPRPEPLRVDTKSMCDLLPLYRKERVELIEFASKLPMDRTFIIEYERYFESDEIRNKINTDLLTFLGVETTQLSSPHVKVSIGNLAEDITNLGEVRAALEGTEFESNLEEGQTLERRFKPPPKTDITEIATTC